ncbi:TetR/AcrR family transcriptional regulator [Croceivirga thetidis]|uniref:TetR/AcrR family transcriptional regulator n=1 Tax=Croceivirga thetidis TaxID=2721623 RepID=A0ABX1GLT2_9FLAO|nr:TetR/AcrR family transcriptional regulator [Croceivirga thetidis]NKI30877.1 TetR/AcrR family transcriptional regulator [Croceivirga thetidis]
MPRSKQFCEEETLKKAVELFWEKGFHATSMQDLVSHLGINRASLYDTYGGKEQLFDKAFAQYRESAGSWLEALFREETSVKLGFKKLFATAIEEATTDSCRKGCFVVNTTTELIPGHTKIERVLLEHKDYVEKLFSSYVQQGIDSGEIPKSKNANELGLMLYTLYNGIRVVSKVDTNQKKLQKVADAGLSILD